MRSRPASPFGPMSLAVVLLASAAGLSACSSAIGPPEHILLSDGRGRPLDPAVAAKDRVPLAPPQEGEYLARMFDSLHAHFQAGDAAGRPRRLLIFIHGGLNDESSAIRRVNDKAPAIEAAGYYPLFINWRSSLPSSYGYHLAFVRGGRFQPLPGVFTSPLYLLADLARAIGRFPVTTYQQVVDHGINDSWKAKFCSSRSLWNQNYCALRRAYENNPGQPGVLHVSAGPKRDTTAEGARATTSFLLKSPFKLLTAPFLDAGGPAAWRIMKRRTELLLRSDPTRDSSAVEPAEGSGPIAKFFQRLQAAVSCNPGDMPFLWDREHREIDAAATQIPCLGDVEITLVAHSMGAIVANRILASFPDVRIHNIVYMAAASSVAEYEDTVWSYMSRERNAETKLYHLVLDDFAEVRDRYVWDFVPRGSLLVWVDEFLSEPPSLRDRTVGRFSNLMLHLPRTPPDLRHRIFVRTFGVGDSVPGPQSHGAFGGEEFWNPAFWRPTDEVMADADKRCAADVPRFCLATD